MASESSFDVVSKVDRQEVDNALGQTGRELTHRFDFKNTGASIAWSGEKIEMRAGTEERVKAVLDVFKDKLIKPYLDVDLKYYDLGMENRDKTDDKVTLEAAAAIRQYNVGVKCATITP